MTFYLTIAMMNFTTVFGTMLLFIELSSLFLSFRYLLFKHDLGQSPLSSVNSILFVVTFGLARIVYQSYLILVMGFPNIIREFVKNNNGTIEPLAWWKKAFYVEMIFLLVLSMAINFWWFYLIVGQAKRALGRLSSK